MGRIVFHFILMLGLCACTKYTCLDPLGAQGSCSEFAFDTSQSVNNSTSFSYTWDFSQAGEYSFNSPITISSGSATVSPLDTTDDDNDASTGFGAGETSDVEWSDSEVGLTLSLPSSSSELPSADSNDFVNMANTGVLLHMDEASPSHGELLTDSGGESLTTTLYTSDGTTSKHTQGVVGGAIYFDGVDDSIAFNEGGNGIMDENSSEFTYMTWFKPEGGSISSFAINGDACTQGGMGLWTYWSQPTLPGHRLVMANVASNGVIIYELTAGWVNTVAAYQAPIYDWTHIALVSEDATHMYLYINGTRVATAINTAATRELNIAQVGTGSCVGATYFRGSIDEFAVLTRAISATDVKNIYNAQRPDRKLSLPTFGSTSEWFPLTGLMLNVPFDIPAGWDTTANAITDRSGNGNALTAATVNDIASPGKVGQGAFADKSGNGYYTAANESNFDFELTSPFSLAAWFKTANYGGGVWSGIMGKVSNGCGGGYPAGHTGYWLQMNHGDGAIYWTLAPSVSAITTKTTRAYNDGAWHHIVATYDGSQVVGGLKIYMDGIEDPGSVFDAGPAAGTLLHDAPFVVASAGVGCADSMDNIDEVAVWSRELSSTEAENIFRSQSSRFTGIFKSRVMDSSDSTTWNTLSWEPKAPYGKNLPDDNEAETAYDDGNVDMLDAILLYHLDETSGNYTDSSSSGVTGTPSNVTQGKYGKINRAASFNGSSSYIETASTSALQSQSLTISVWVRPRSINGGQVDIFDYDHANSHNYTIQCDAGLACYLGYFDSGANTWLGTGYVYLKYNQWQHIVFTKSGTRRKGYLDGVLVSDVTAGGNGIITFGAAVARVGSNTTLGRYFDGEIDEFAIFSSAFTDSQVEALYERHAKSILYQVRSCSDASCTNTSFVGPDGSTSSYYSELNNSSLGLPSALSLSGSGLSANPYFQYQALFFSDSGNTSYAPVLKSLSIGKTLGSSSPPAISLNSGIRFSALTGFIESRGQTNAGTITYQVSTDAGNTWYWYSSGWRVTSAGVSESSSASTIHSNISTLPVGAGRFVFRAYLNSNSRTANTQLRSITLEGRQ